MKRKIIIDCDPGHDDAIAILVAAAHPALDLLAITTVAGNAGLDQTTLNALKVCEMAGIGNVPVAPGAGRPLVRNGEAAPAIHGSSGMDGPVLPEPSLQAAEEHAVDLIIRRLMESEGDITLVPVGPLTNIALALRREPRIVPKIQEIVLMGGGTFGNWTPAAEFNIWADAEAAQIVFGSGAPVTMIGLDATHQALATPDINGRIGALGNRVSGFAYELLQYFGRTYKQFFNFDHPPVHDVCSVVYCIDPAIFDCRFLNVTVETKGELSYGMTLVDIHGVTGRPPNINTALGLDHEKLWDVIIGALGRYGEGDGAGQD
ncbi:ribosylpyrimidine nucleosidase [Paenibacillus sp. URB8-2]|nr:ribosylpyrimidine nucleosidase [Paenibacillus sp. URB8-2]